MVVGLDAVRSVVERILDDRVQVWREVGRQGGDSGTMVGESGELLEPPVPGAALVWSGLGAVLRSVDPTALHQAVLPVGAALVRVDDVLVVRGSVRGAGRDPGLVGQLFRIAEANVGTDPVVRVVLLEAIG